MDQSSRKTISAFIVCCNEQDQIRRCLSSVKWCDEIVVIDSGSTDRTIEICQEFTQKIISRAWPGFVEQKRFGLSQCAGDWVLNIDADEEVSPQLRDEITGLLTRDFSSQVPENGFLLPRTVYYMGKWWRKGGWYPEFRLRFCRRSHTSWGGDDPHEKAIVQGPVGRLAGELHHFTYDELADQVRSLNSLSSAGARTLFTKGQRFSLMNGLLIRPLIRFFKFYVLKRGYREGMPGFIVALMETWAVFLKYAKLWELNHRDPERNR